MYHIGIYGGDLMEEFLSGCRRSLPIALGYFPVSFSFGVFVASKLPVLTASHLKPQKHQKKKKPEWLAVRTGNFDFYNKFNIIRTVCGCVLNACSGILYGNRFDTLDD